MSLLDVFKRLLSLLLNPRARYRRSDVADNGRSAPPDPASEELIPAPRLQPRHFLSNAPFMLGASILLTVFLVMLIGPLYVRHDPFITTQTTLPHFDSETNTLISPPFEPSAEFLLGTDDWGNDLLSLIVYGSRVTLVTAVYITLIRLLLGLGLGALAGWNEGKWADRLVMGLINFITAIPLLISSMILLLILDVRQGASVFLIALSVVGWTEIAQYVRGELLVIRQLDYIEGAEAIGMTHWQTLVRHALPNILPQLLVITFLEMGAVLLLLAELGFLGIFVGGATSFVMDPFGGGVFSLLEAPEWGALVAQGAPALRAAGYQVLAPTLAFFIVIVGLNTFAEGVRRLIERAPLSTAFLLRREMGLVVVGLALLTMWVLNITGPTRSYARAAAQFDGAQAAEFLETITAFTPRTAGQPGAIAASEFINEQMVEFDVARGYIEPLRSYRKWDRVITMTQPATPPQLSLTAAGTTTTFTPNLDFGYQIDGHGGSGQADAPLTYLGFTSEPPAATLDFSGLDVAGHILLLREADAPPNFTTEALRRGALGVLLLREEPVIRSQKQVMTPTAVLQKQTLPVFVVGTAVWNAILQGENLTADALLNGDFATQTGPGWFAHDLTARTDLSLQLTPPEPVIVPHVIGFLPGYDMERADEVIVLVTSYDSLSPSLTAPNETATGTAVLLEIARLFQQINLDPRRSVLLIAWGGGELADPGLDAYLSDIYNFRRLNAATPTGLMHPVAIIELDQLGAGGDRLWLDPDSDPVLLDLFIDSLDATDVAYTLDEAEENGRLDGRTDTDLPTLVFQWENAPGYRSAQAGQIDAVKLQQAGESVAHFLIRITREIDYGRGIEAVDTTER